MTNLWVQGRMLEEVDDLFAAKLPAWRFRGHQTRGMVHLLATLESEKDTAVKAAVAQEIEETKGSSVNDAA
jgi:hypothetical protein